MKIVCGKAEHVWDSETIQFSRYLDPNFTAPTRYSFDKVRSPFPLEDWGSSQRQCDVLASQANQLLRFGRLDQRRNIPLRGQDVIQRYRNLAGIRKWGDENDHGLSVWYAMKKWYQEGWDLGGKNYRTILYGEIEPNERALLRTAIYIFRGVHIGFWLPRTAPLMTEWKYNGEMEDDWKPGSLGGILAYCNTYDQHGYEIMYGGQRIYVTNEFVERFSDECWICVESLDYWARAVLDMQALLLVRPTLAMYLREEG